MAGDDRAARRPHLGARLRDPLAGRAPRPGQQVLHQPRRATPPEGLVGLRQEPRRRIQRAGLCGRPARHGPQRERAARPAGPDQGLLRRARRRPQRIRGRHLRLGLRRGRQRPGRPRALRPRDRRVRGLGRRGEQRHGWRRELPELHAHRGAGGRQLRGGREPLRPGGGLRGGQRRVGGAGGPRHGEQLELRARGRAVRIPAQRGRDRLGGRRGGEAPQLPVELSRHDRRQLGDEVRLGRSAALLPVPERVHELRRAHGGRDPLLLVLIGGHREGGRDGGTALLGRPQRRANAHRQRGPPAVHHEGRRHRLPDGEAAGAGGELRHQPVGREQALPLDPRLRRVLRLRAGERGPHGARGGRREHPARGRDHRPGLVHDRLPGRRPARGAGPGGRPPCTLLRLRGVGRARDHQGPGRTGLRSAERVPARVRDAPGVLEPRAPQGTPWSALLGLDGPPARGAREPAHERAARHPGR